MKSLSIIAALLTLVTFKAFSCTCDPAYELRGFCQVISESQNKPMFCIVQGRVLSYYHYGMYIEVTENIYNTAMHDTIVVWADNGACCRPGLAFEQIQPGDTLVMALEQTDLCGNWIAPLAPDYEDSSDYVLQGCGAYFMRYRNGEVFGVFESGGMPDTLDYTSFVAQIHECLTSSTVACIGAAETVTVYPNPSKDIVQVTSSSLLGGLTLLNSLGQSVYDGNIEGKKATVYVGGFTPGIYILLVYDKERKVITRQKLVLQ